MSGLVFVRDAEGHPLMPMSPAYARTLVHQGKAQVIPHPAVSTIQLTRTVTTPTLRPVVVGLALNATTADIILVIEQARALPVSLHLVVDLRVPASHTWTTRRQVIRRGRTRRSPRAYISSWLLQYSSVLISVISACQHLVPISHLVLLPSRRASALPPVRSTWIGRHIQRHAGNIAFVHQDELTAGHLPVPLMQLLINSLSPSTTRHPDVVVCVIMRKRRSFPERNDWSTRLGTIRQAGRRTTGIIHRSRKIEPLKLRVPTHVHDHGVQWEELIIPNPEMLYVWPSTSILMMPLWNARHHGESIS